MLLLSLDQATPLGQYHLFTFLAAAFSLVLFFTFMFKTQYSVKKSSLLTSIFFGLFYYFAYTHLDKFYALKQHGQFLTLSYAPPAQDKMIMLSDIESISFGVANRGGSSCYLAITITQGTVYQSAAIEKESSECKSIRQALLSLVAEHQAEVK